MRQKSVTLIEIIVSMVILSLILLGIAGLFVAGKRQLKRAQYKQEVLNFTREKLEELGALDFDDDCLQELPGGSTYPTVDCEDTRILPYGWQRTWIIIDEDLDQPPDGIADRKKITVTIQWQEP
ncbi:MAG: prepilin-type N-terminal cleavage/methylation domain-containing protein [Candidatus Omnitrophota bacterium]